MNEALEDDYTDLEKALALYVYFEEHYEYDYDTYEKMDEQSPDYISGYRLMTTGTGICQEISTAYSFLLMQAGVNATVMSGRRSYDQESHRWSYVRINGKTYHIDPTYVLGSDHYLGYFMMTDEQREECDSYTPDTFVIASNYSQDHPHPDYKADDTFFEPVWDTYLDSFDHDTGKMNCRYYDDNFDEKIMEFDYSGF